MNPEAQARQTIDASLVAAGWAIQDYKAYHPSAARGIALREVYRIKTETTARGGLIGKGFYVDRRSKETRTRRLELLDEDLPFAATDLDRSVVVPSQNRTVLTTYHDALGTDLFPGRNLQRAARLRQSVLQQAFSGQLQ